MLTIIHSIGIQWDGSSYEGEPTGTSKEDTELIKALLIEFPNDSALISINLDNHSIKDVLSPNQLTKLKSYQCQKIRELRQAAYKELSDPLYMAHIADGDSIALFNSAREAVKKMYPWPGEYR